MYTQLRLENSVVCEGTVKAKKPHRGVANYLLSKWAFFPYGQHNLAALISGPEQGRRQPLTMMYAPPNQYFDTCIMYILYVVTQANT